MTMQIIAFDKAKKNPAMRGKVAVTFREEIQVCKPSSLSLACNYH